MSLALLVDAGDESVETTLSLFWSQSGVSGQILHDVEVIAHLICQTLIDRYVNEKQVVVLRWQCSYRYTCKVAQLWDE